MKLRITQEKQKRTNVKRYGVLFVSQNKTIRKKQKNTCFKKYGYESPLSCPKIFEKTRHTLKKRYGINNPMESLLFIDKIFKKRKENGSLNTSIPEKEILKFLKIHYPNIEYQYKSEDYPFNCDFYIPELKLYLEFQGNWTHGKEPYNGYNLPTSWLEKRDEGSKYYKSAIDTFTKRDPLKRKIAHKNNLRYLEIWYEDYKKGLEYIKFLIEDL